MRLIGWQVVLGPMERAAQQASPSIYFEVISGGALWHAKTTFFSAPCEVCNRPLAYALSKLGCSRKFTHRAQRKRPGAMG